MSTTFGTTRFLVIGFGNPGRVDDGLGPALAECVAALGQANVATEAYYQLSVEDCLEVALADVVIFVDATVEQEHAFDLRPLAADPELSFTTHAVSPGAILALAESVHGARPEAYLLTIRGHEFDRFSEGLSLAGRRDLAAAFEFLTPLLQARDPDLLRERAAALALEHRSLPAMADTLKILYVDDDQDYLDNMRVILESAGYAMVEARGAEDGLEVFELERPDAVLVDLMMEEVDSGTGLVKELLLAGAVVPVFLVSSVGEGLSMNIDPSDLGLAGVFQKPVDPGSLLASLAAKLKPRS